MTETKISKRIEQDEREPDEKDGNGETGEKGVGRPPANANVVPPKSTSVQNITYFRYKDRKLIKVEKIE